MMRNAAAATTWAATVPQADPAMPRSSPYTSSTSSARLSVLAAIAMTSVVRVSCMPRRYPAPASAMSMNGAPSRLMRR
jgi:hypothetical protein